MIIIIYRTSFMLHMSDEAQTQCGLGAASRRDVALNFKSCVADISLYKYLCTDLKIFLPDSRVYGNRVPVQY